MDTNNNYQEILQQAIFEIKSARIAIARQINHAANGVYWNLGKLLSEKKIEKGHGAGVVNRLSTDLKAQFPDMGLTPRNLWNMKRFYERYVQSESKLQRSVAVLPWRHNLLLLEKTTTNNEALFYAEKALALGWSRDISCYGSWHTNHNKESNDNKMFGCTMGCEDTHYGFGTR